MRRFLNRYRMVLGATCLLLSATLSAQDVGEPDPLFRDDSVLELTLEAPLTTLIRERPVDEQYPAEIRYLDANGEEVQLPLRVRTRGNFRRNPDNCGFPPIRLRFRAAEVEGSLFEGLTRVPLVTHCQNSSRYEQGVLREYLAYRLLNELTPLSLRARLFRITYIDSDGRLRDRETFGFGIEHRERLAARAGLTALEIGGTSIGKLDAEYLNLTSLFQFMIGNTDFSPIAAPAGERCCHNHRLLGAADLAPPQFSVPYDFDMTGLVNLPHSVPAPGLNLRSVTNRRYRGRCRNNHLVPRSVETFEMRRAALLALVDNLPGATDRTRGSLRTFIEGFYAVIDDPERVERNIVGRCL